MEKTKQSGISSFQKYLTLWVFTCMVIGVLSVNLRLLCLPLQVNWRLPELLITDIPEPDIAISMGCNVGCPFVGRPFDDNWGLDDPTGQSDDVFKEVIGRIAGEIIG